MPIALLNALGFARSHWKLIGFGLLALLLAIQSVRLGHAHNQLERAKINLNECRQGRIDDRKAYEGAQKKAAELNQAEVKRITDEQDRISSNVENDLHARLERLRGELRKGNAPAPRDTGGPAAGSPVQGAPGASGEAGVCLTPEDHVRAAENEERHDQLITLVEQQLGVKR